MKLEDRVGKHEHFGRIAARMAIRNGRVRVNGAECLEPGAEVDRFMEIVLDSVVIQPATPQLFLVMHKPAGVVSATKDAKERTVLDLISHPAKDTLHLLGRLDKATTGLLLLTNDGRWSKQLMDSEQAVAKTYRVETESPISPESITAFAAGVAIHGENQQTKPAQLTILAPTTARLTLTQGLHHQIKKMFRSVGNRVTALHRENLGNLRLPTDLAAGEWRELTPTEKTAAEDSQ